MPLPTTCTRNPGALIMAVGGGCGVHACRIVVYANSIAALQVRTAARQGGCVVVGNPRAKVHEQSASKGQG